METLNQSADNQSISEVYKIIKQAGNEISACKRDSFTIQIKVQLDQNSMNLIKRVFPVYDINQDFVENPITGFYVNQILFNKER